MSHTITTSAQKLDDVLAQAKALRFAAANKAIGYQEAKVRAEELLNIVNAAGEKIAKKFGRRHRKIRFSDL